MLHHESSGPDAQTIEKARECHGPRACEVQRHRARPSGGRRSGCARGAYGGDRRRTSPAAGRRSRRRARGRRSNLTDVHGRADGLPRRRAAVFAWLRHCCSCLNPAVGRPPRRCSVSSISAASGRSNRCAEMASLPRSRRLTLRSCSSSETESCVAVRGCSPSSGRERRAFPSSARAEPARDTWADRRWRDVD